MSFILNILGFKRESEAFELYGNADMNSYLDAVANKVIYSRKYMDMYKEKQLDCIICPASPLPPLKHGQSKELFISLYCKTFFNLLDYPTGVIPNAKIYVYKFIIN
jgi:Asp-tRNA(Asn)/Glu-tRNA(Gln) amidotransferase A subunit family amidase